MDIATLFAALAMCGLIQGLLLLIRWGRAEHSNDLLWSGSGCLLIGIGAGLYGARYFGMPLPVIITYSNALLLLGMGLLGQGPRVSDGHPPDWLGIAGAPLIWIAACTFESFIDSPAARLRLYSLLSAVISGLAALHLARGGLRPPGRKILLGLWSMFAVTMAARMIATDGVAAGLGDRYAASAWHAAYLLICTTALMCIGYVNLALSHERAAAAPIAAALADELASRVDQGEPIGNPDATIHKRALWTLRINRALKDISAPQHLKSADISELAGIISTICSPIYDVRRAGDDRILWRNDTGQSQTALQHAALTNAIRAHIARPCSSIGAMACGVAACHGGHVLATAAIADRHSVLILHSGNGGSPPHGSKSH